MNQITTEVDNSEVEINKGPMMSFLSPIFNKKNRSAPNSPDRSPKLTRNKMKEKLDVPEQRARSYSSGPTGLKGNEMELLPSPMDLKRSRSTDEEDLLNQKEAKMRSTKRSISLQPQNDYSSYCSRRIPDPEQFKVQESEIVIKVHKVSTSGLASPEQSPPLLRKALVNNQMRRMEQDAQVSRVVYLVSNFYNSLYSCKTELFFLTLIFQKYDEFDWFPPRIQSLDHGLTRSVFFASR